jgi:ATP diphosphatase
VTDAASSLKRLIDIMATLRDPERGCPWDRVQTFATIAPYTIEEAYEVADAIERGAMDDLKDELGDLLLQVVYHARMAEEAGLFAFADVAEAIGAKMIRRHPHVFGGEGGDGGPHQWDAIKKKEREAKAEAQDEDAFPSLFGDVPAGLPALAKSQKLQRRASRMGFDWPSVDPILDKLDEEIGELRVEISAEPGPETHCRQFEEFGDVMFVLVNLGLRLGIDAEAALRSANAKFIRRMDGVAEGARADGRTLETMTLDEMEVLWSLVKASERSGGGR